MLNQIKVHGNDEFFKADFNVKWDTSPCKVNRFMHVPVQSGSRKSSKYRKVYFTFRGYRVLNGRVGIT